MVLIHDAVEKKKEKGKALDSFFIFLSLNSH